MTEADRMMYWSQFQNVFQVLLPRYAYTYPTITLLQCGYNAALLSKGILLNLSRNLSELIQSDGDKESLNLLEELKRNRLMLDRQYNSYERTLDTDSLEKVVNDLERKLIQKSQTYGDYVKDMSIQWKDVQEKLSAQDVSIEFVSFPLNKDSVMYMAYVLQKGFTHPELVPLFEEKQLRKDMVVSQNAKLSAIIWQPLSHYLKEKKNVYFSPAGELYNIPIEALSHWEEDCLLSDKWNMYRLSSTRELAISKDKKILKQASVYGGVKYDAGKELLVSDSKRYSHNRTYDMSTIVLGDSLGMRSGVAYLPATKAEVEEIKDILTKKSILTTLRMDTLATEGDVKNLSGKRKNLLHIATHGFYWSEREAKYRSNLGFLTFTNNLPQYFEDKAMTRSGLLMAGANNALMGEKLSQGIDDGILTAKEISQMDLRGLDLVVLSACETGLGEIKGDGVFGLQRGFKKAGANSLLMSLWKVDDEATRLLMTQFYKNLTLGMSKYESLKQAQKYVREYEVKVEVKSDIRPSISARAKEQLNNSQGKTWKKVRKFESPLYWAAFILLDAK